MARTISPVLALALLTACAVGPSTRFKAEVQPVASRADSATSPATRAFLDSLAAARGAAPATPAARTAPAPNDSGGARPGSSPSAEPAARRADTAARALPAPMVLAVDTARDLAWLDVLRDSQLVALVRTAIENNRDLRVAQARVQEFRAQLGVARSGLLPKLSATGAASRNKSALGPSVFEYDAVRVTGDIAWELDFWGRLRRQHEAAIFDLGAMQEDARATALTLVSDVATAYLAVRELDAEIAVAEQTLASRQSALDLARRRFAQGVVSELDVRQFEAQLAEPAARVAEFGRVRTQRENALALLLGQRPSSIPRGRALEDAVQALAVPDSVPGDLIARRPDVIRAQRSLQAASARVGVAIGNRLPSIVIGGQYGAQRPDFNGLFDQTGEIYTAQVGISIPLFTGGRLMNEERAARARAEQARGQYEKTVLNALREASDALAGVRLTRDQLVAQATQVQALQRALALAEQRYRSGISSYLEVLDAQRGLFTAQITHVQVQRQYLVSTVDLFRALGGSWEMPEGK
jgi:multidrug efflux system outer membrane protein